MSAIMLSTGKVSCPKCFNQTVYLSTNGAQGRLYTGHAWNFCSYKHIKLHENLLHPYNEADSRYTMNTTPQLLAETLTVNIMELQGHFLLCLNDVKCWS